MAIARRIVSIIAAICILFECIQISAGGDLNVAQYFGVWREVGILIPKGPPNHEIVCEWFISTPSESCLGCFDETYGKLRDGRNSTKNYGFGLIMNSEVHVTYPTISKALLILAATTYNDGKEVILCEKINHGNCKALSRTTTISEETKAAFERLADAAGHRTVYLNPTVC